MARVTRLVFQSQFPADYVTPRPARRSILRSPPLHSRTANHCVAVSERFGVVDQVERSRFKAPIWPYFEETFSGHGPIVWIRRSSGLGTLQTSFTPSSHTCGSRPLARSNSRIAAPERWQIGRAHV